MTMLCKALACTLLENKKGAQASELRCRIRGSSKLHSVSGSVLNPQTAVIPSFAFVSLLRPAPDAKEMET
jgi:hypothetical protein